MAYDVVRGTCCGRDWSMGGGGTPLRSLAYHAEMQRRDKVLALAKLVDSEISNNASITALRTRAKTMLASDESRWSNFVIAWHSWQAKNLAADKSTSQTTIADLERWRIENVEWTKRLTTAIPLPPSASPAKTRGLTRPGGTTPDDRAKESSTVPVVLGLSGLALVLLGLMGVK